MAQTIKLKRSGTQGAAPTTSNLALGEVAINTYDGKMYIKKDVGGTESIVEIGGSGSVSYLEAGMVEYEYTATSNQTTFSGSDSNSATLSYTANSILVFLNGVLQDDGVDYTATNGTSVVFGSALTANDEVRIIAINTVASTSSLQNPTKLDAISTVNNQAAYSLTLSSSAYTPSSQNALIVSLNGITQEPGDSFTISGSTITFSPALVTGDVVDYIVDMGRAVTIGQYDSDLVVTGDITPGADSTYDLGASGTEWANVYADTFTGNLTGNVTGTVSSLSNHDTDDLSEGSTNLYFTTARVDSHLSGGTGVTYNAGEISIGQDVGTTATPTFGNITTTGYIAGPSTFTIDPAAVGDNTGTLVVAGNLQVDGTTTTINSTTMTVDDLNITLASGAANAAAANGAGITVDGASATLTYNGTNDDWNFNKDLNVSGNLTSTGIDDNASSTALTISSAGATTFSGDVILSESTPRLDFFDTDVTDSNFRVAMAGPTMYVRSRGGTSDYGQIRYQRNNDGSTNLSVFGTTTGGDIIFYDADGSTEGLRWDASTSRLGLSDGTPATMLQVGNSGIEDSNAYITFGKRVASTEDNLPFIGQDDYDGGSHNDLGLGVRSNNGTINFYTGNAAAFTTSNRRMTIATNGDVGIGATPAQRLDVREEKTGGGVLVQVYNEDNSDTTTQTAGLALGPDSRGGTARITAIKENADFSTNAGRDVALTFSSVLNNSPTERMRINALGNVGIGTDSPAQLLDVGDHTVVGNRSIRISQRTGTGAQTYGGLEFFYNNTAGTTGVNAAIYYAAGSQRNYGELAFYTGNAGTITERVRIERSGSVGIGTNSPSARLHVRADTGGSDSIMRIRNENTTSRTTTLQLEDYSGTLADGVLKFVFPNAGSTTDSYLALLYNSAGLFIAPGGNVGVGTSTPVYNLHIHETGSGGVWTMYSNDTTGSASGNGALVGIDSNEEFNIRVYENKPIDFWTNNSHRARITNGGEFHLYTGVLDLTDSEDPALPVSIESTGTLGNGGTYDSSLKDSGQLQYNAASHLFADTSSVVNSYPNSWYEIDNGFRWGLSTTEVLTVNSNGNVQVDIGGAAAGLSALSITSNPFTIGSLTDFNVAFDTNEIQARNNGGSNNLILNKNGGTVGIGTTDTSAVLSIEASGDNGIKYKGTNNHATLFLDSASGYGQYLRFSEAGTNNWWIVADTVGDLNFRPNASSQYSMRLRENYKIETVANDTVCDATYYAVTINNAPSGSDTTTADRTHVSLFVNTDSTQSGGNTSDEVRTYGLYADTRVTADSDLVVGVMGYARSDKTSGTTTNVRGGQFQALAHDTAGGIVSTCTGIYASAGHYNVETTATLQGGSFLAQVTATGDGNLTNLEGIRAETQVDGGYAGTITTGYTLRCMHDNNNGATHTHNTHYLMYGDYTGTLPTTARGLWITDNVPSRFGGDLEVVGTLTKTAGSFKISHPLPSMANTHDLIHSFVESPQPDNVYTGMITLVDGSATINIDTAAGMTEGTFVLLNKNIRRTVTNEEGFTAVKCSLSENILTITAQDNTCTDEVFWMVIGQRQDSEIKALNSTDSEGNLIVEPEKGPEWIKADRSNETTTSYDPENPFPDQE